MLITMNELTFFWSKAVSFDDIARSMGVVVPLLHLELNSADDIRKYK